MRGASRIPVRGRPAVAKFLRAFAPKFWAGTALTWIEANGRPSVLISRDDAAVALLAVSASADGIDQLMWVLSPTSWPESRHRCRDVTDLDDPVTNRQAIRS